MIDLNELDRAMAMTQTMGRASTVVFTSHLAALVRLARADVALDRNPVSSDLAMSRNEALKPFLSEDK